MENKIKGIERTSSWIRGIASGTLAVILTYLITSSLNLSGSIKYPIMILACLLTSYIVASRPRFVLILICILVFSIGAALILLSPNQEMISNIGWDAGLLGAGASIVAIAIALYVFLIQTEQEWEAEKLNNIERKISNLEKGYVWLEETKKYRCEYCLKLGKYHCNKTLGGIQRHITAKHK